MRFHLRTTLLCLTIFLSAISTALFSCKRKIAIEQRITTAPSLKIKINDQNNLVATTFGQLFTNWKIIDLNGKNKQFISTIDKVCLYKNKLFLLDRKLSSLNCYDSTGRFLLSYGKLGLGINEYKKLTDFDIDSTNGEIIIYSRPNQSIYRYDLENGMFKKRLLLQLFGSGICNLENGKLLLYVNYCQNRNYLAANAILVNEKGRVEKNYFRFDSQNQDVDFENTGFISKSSGNVFFSNAFCDTVYKFKDNDFTPYMSFDFGDDSISKLKWNSRKLIASDYLFRPNASFLRAHFLINSHAAIFTYQGNLSAKIGIYNIKRQNLNIVSTDPNDALLYLARDPLYLDDANRIYFNIYPQDILLLKKQKPNLIALLPTECRNILDSSTIYSGSYLLSATLKTDL
jgi:hypothetical protein